MNLRSRFGFLGLTLAAMFVLAACGGTSSGGGSATAQNIGTNGESLAFDKATLSAPAGQAVTIAFKNNSSGTQHNFVVVKGGDTEAQAVDDAAASAPNNIPTDPNISGHTNLVAGGASESVQINLPAGTYTYLCTVPGHYGAGMKGTLTVQ